MVDAGVVPSETYVGDDPLTPSQNQKQKYKNGLPVFKAYYEKLDDSGKTFKDKDGKPVIINGKDALMGTILRSEEHTSELQSRQYLVCRLLLEKKKNKKIQLI